MINKPCKRTYKSNNYLLRIIFVSLLMLVSLPVFSAVTFQSYATGGSSTSSTSFTVSMNTIVTNNLSSKKCITAALYSDISAFGATVRGLCGMTRAFS